MRHFSVASILILTAIAGCTTDPATDMLPYYSDADLTPQWIDADDPMYHQIHTIAPFHLINQNADVVTEDTFAGSIYVADFFFATCPGICPTMTKNMLTIQEAYRNDSDIMFLSHTVTPEIDTPEVLNRYGEEYGILPEKWHLVTGAREEIYTLARQSYFAEEDLGLPVNESDFLHTELFFLIDTNGRIRGIYKGTFPNEMTRLIADIKLLKEEGPA